MKSRELRELLSRPSIILIAVCAAIALLSFSDSISGKAVELLSYTCTDSDDAAGGWNTQTSHTAGYVEESAYFSDGTADIDRWKDRCSELATNVLYEQYCVPPYSGAPRSKYVPQDQYIECGEGYYCNDSSGYAYCAQVEQPLQSCTDSDGGIDYYERGVQTISAFGQSITEPDACIIWDQRTLLREFYCIGDLAYIIQQDCTALGMDCKDGACVAQAKCVDSDGGEVFGIKGTANVIKDGELYIYEDWCTPQGKLNEQWCDGVVPRTSGPHFCGSDKVCSNGACVQKECIDSDGGLNYYYKGEVTLMGYRKYYDECKDKNTLRELQCVYDGSTSHWVISPEDHRCERTEICFKGACIFAGSKEAQTQIKSKKK